MEHTQKKVVVLLAHPDIYNSNANKTLIEAINDPVDVLVYNLYEQEELEFEEWARIMSHACALVFQFPFSWMSCPSLLKKWMDDVLSELADTPSIAGKPLLVATTTGSAESEYRSGGLIGFTVDELLRPFQASAIHAGMIWKTPLIAHGMGTLEGPKNLSIAAELYKEKINALKDKRRDNW